MSVGGLVSVVIPVFNAERFVAEAIESVLGQEGAEVEVVVVDDGSTDGSVAVAERFGDAVRVVRGEHAGIGAARNRGVEGARGEYVAFLDADDLWARGKLARQLGVLMGADAPELVFGMMQQFRGEPGGERVRDGEPLPGYFAGAMLTRLETFRRVGPFTTEWRVGEFVDWNARAQDLGLRSAMLEQVVLWRRLHDSNTARMSAGGQQDFVGVVRAALQRRRGAGA